MANQRKKTVAPETITFKVRGSIKYFGKASGKFAKTGETTSQLSFIPCDEQIEQLRKDLKDLYETSDLDEKWFPEFITKGASNINLKSRFDIKVLFYDDGKSVETTLLDFVADYGTPVKGTPIMVNMKFKNGGIYPVAIKFEKDLSEIDFYSLESLFS